MSIMCSVTSLSEVDSVTVAVRRLDRRDAAGAGGGMVAAGACGSSGGAVRGCSTLMSCTGYVDLFCLVDIPPLGCVGCGWGCRL
jgi:hypothetical protein